MINVNLDHLYMGELISLKNGSYFSALVSIQIVIVHTESGCEFIAIVFLSQYHAYNIVIVAVFGSY